MKQLEPEIKRVYQKLIFSFLLIIAVSLCLQLTGGKQWAALIPLKVDQGEWWRLLSAHFIHINWQHFGMNMVGVFLCLLVFRHDVPPSHWLISAITISLFSSFFLYLVYEPQQSYVGFSDVLHGWIGMGIFAMLPKETKLASAMLAFCLFKVFYENFYSPPSADMLDGSRVATESHLFGCLGGGLFSLVFNPELRSFLFNIVTAKHK